MPIKKTLQEIIMRKVRIKQIKKNHLKWYNSSKGIMKPKNLLLVVDVMQRLYSDGELYPKFN